MTRARFIGRSVAIAVALASPYIAFGCGGDSDEKPAPAPSGGAGGEENKPEPIECGDLTCEPFDEKILEVLGQPPLAACCASKGRCGLDSSVLTNFGLAFSEVCQAKGQE